MGKKIVDKKKVDNGYLLPFDTKAVDEFRPDGIGDGVIYLRPFTKGEQTEYKRMARKAVESEEYAEFVHDNWAFAGKCITDWKLKYLTDGECKYTKKGFKEAFDGFPDQLKDMIANRVLYISGLSRKEKEVLD